MNKKPLENILYRMGKCGTAAPGCASRKTTAGGGCATHQTCIGYSFPERRSKGSKWLAACCALLTTCCLLLAPSPLLACAACFKSGADSQVVQAMNWAILCLLGFVGGVLGSLILFIFYLRRKAAAPKGVAMHFMNPEDTAEKTIRPSVDRRSPLTRETGFAPRSRSPSLAHPGGHSRRFHSSQ